MTKGNRPLYCQKKYGLHLIYQNLKKNIGESYILIAIPFDETVLDVAKANRSVGINVGTNVGLSSTQKKIISIKKGVTKRTIEPP